MNKPGKVTLLIGALLFMSTISTIPAFAKDKPAKQPNERYSVEQVGATPSFTVMNDSKNDDPIAIELTLYDAAGNEQTSKAWDKQVIEPGTSQEYSLGPLFLTPGGSPYRVVASVYKASKKHKLIETVDPAGTFTVAH